MQNQRIPTIRPNSVKLNSFSSVLYLAYLKLRDRDFCCRAMGAAYLDRASHFVQAKETRFFCYCEAPSPFKHFISGLEWEGL